MGKGSNKRPIYIPRKTFKDNWDRIFTNREKNKDKTDTKRTIIGNA